MASISVLDQINNFTSTVNTLGVDSPEKRLYVDADLGRVYHVDATKPPSDLAKINKLVCSMLDKDLSFISLKQVQLLRRSFCNVIDNYRDYEDAACKEAEDILVKIPSRGKIFFTGAEEATYCIYDPTNVKIAFKPVHLKPKESRTESYIPKLLSPSSLSDSVSEKSCGILLIQNAISKKFFRVNDYSGKYVIAMIGDALSAAERMLRKTSEPAKVDCTLFCWEWIKKSLVAIDGSKDLVNPERFLLLEENGWVLDTPENRAMHKKIGKSWIDDEDRKVEVFFPEEYREKFEEIFCDEEIEASIEGYFAMQQEPQEACCTDLG